MVYYYAVFVYSVLYIIVTVLMQSAYVWRVCMCLYYRRFPHLVTFDNTDKRTSVVCVTSVIVTNLYSALVADSVLFQNFSVQHLQD